MSHGVPSRWAAMAVAVVVGASCTGGSDAVPSLVTPGAPAEEPTATEAATSLPTANEGMEVSTSAVTLPDLLLTEDLIFIEELFAKEEIVAVVPEVAGFVETVVVQLSRGALDDQRAQQLRDRGIERVAVCDYTRNELQGFVSYVSSESWRDENSNAVVVTPPVLDTAIYGGMMQHCRVIYRVACTSRTEQNRLTTAAEINLISWVDFSTAAHSFLAYEWDPGKPEDRLGPRYSFRSDADSPKC